MAKYRIQSKLFAGVFDPGTYNAMVNAAANNATPDAQRMLDGYSKKYAEDIAKYKNSTALTTIKPNTNIPTGSTALTTIKPNTNIPTGTNPPNKIGAWQGIKNSWGALGKSKFGTAKQAGIIGAGILGAGLMAKGAMSMMGSGKSKEAAFSEDTNAALKEAAIYGTVGAGILGAGYLAKRGMLGFTKAAKKSNKETYDGIVKKVKAIWTETNGKAKGEVQEAVTTAASGEAAKTTIKKIKFTPEGWKKVHKVIVEKGLDPRNPAHKLEAAKIAGVKPVSVK